MNERHSYEKHLAEKLQQLPPDGDVNHRWGQMKALLDEEMPRGGGGRRWWMTGIIAVILLVGGWLTGSHFLESNPDKQLAAASSKTANDTETPGETTSLSATPGQQQPANSNTMPANEQIAGNSVLPASGIATAEGTNELTGALVASPEPAGTDLAATVAETNIREPGNSIPGRNLAAHSQKQGNPAGRKENAAADQEDQQADDAKALVKTPAPGRGHSNEKINQADETTVRSNSENISNTSAISGKKAAFKTPVIDYSAVNAPGTYVTSPVVAPGKDYIPLPAAKLKNPNRKAMAASKAGRAIRNREEKVLAFGLSLPLAFPLGDQQALSYNFNAGPNAVSDYLPSPHFQYHFNSRTYLQTELQVLAPQYIRPLLLYQHKTLSSTGDAWYYNSVYAKKLYYFNIPVGIHHSPFKNFYLGTGLQFSNLLSGVALFEERKKPINSPQDILLHERYTRFGNDSLSQRMNGTEMRLLLEANYYFNRFTIGLRYNQAFSNYVDFQVNSFSPYTYDKNKTLQFYLRYNLWEKKNSYRTAPTLLSLK